MLTACFETQGHSTQGISGLHRTRACLELGFPAIPGFSDEIAHELLAKDPLLQVPPTSHDLSACSA